MYLELNRGTSIVGRYGPLWTQIEPPTPACYQAAAMLCSLRYLAGFTQQIGRVSAKYISGARDKCCMQVHSQCHVARLAHLSTLPCTPSQLRPHLRALKLHVAAASPATVSAASAAVSDMSDERQWAAILSWRDNLVSRSPIDFHMVKGVSYEGRQVSMLITLHTTSSYAAVPAPWYQLCWHD